MSANSKNVQHLSVTVDPREKIGLLLAFNFWQNWDFQWLFFKFYLIFALFESKKYIWVVYIQKKPKRLIDGHQQALVVDGAQPIQSLLGSCFNDHFVISVLCVD